MKKILIMLMLFVASAISTSSVVVNAAEDYIYLVSSKGVEVTFSNYQKLLNVGYTDNEIKSISSDEYYKISNMNILSIENEEYYIKTTSIENEDGSITSTDETITKDQAYIEIQEIEEQEQNQDEYGVAPTAISHDIMIEDDDNLGGGSSNPSAYSSATTEYKYLTVTGTFYKNQGNLGTFFIKVNLTWLKTPKKRLIDVISINFSDNVQITSEYINGNQYPAFDSKFTYDERYIKIYVNLIDDPEYIDQTTSHEILIDGDDTSNYAYKIDQGLGVNYNLPADIYSDLSGIGYTLRYEYYYSNFYLTLSADFIPKQTGLNAATFAGTYQHQTVTGHFDWGNVSFSPAPPYFSYSTHFWVNDPTFDETLARQIFFEDLA